jgi:hypothetical protein
MSDSELAVVAAQTFPAPILIERAGPSTRKKFFEFFTVPIRNANTRAAYYRAIQQFLAWCERAGYQHLEDIEPITVAAYIRIYFCTISSHSQIFLELTGGGSRTQEVTLVPSFASVSVSSGGGSVASSRASSPLPSEHGPERGNEVVPQSA